MARKPKPLKARDIVSNAFKTDKTNARYVFPGPIIKSRTGYRMVTVTKIPKQKSRQHIVKVDMDPTYSGSFRRCPSVKVDCDCARYLYTWNFALDKRDAAVKDRTTGDAPVVTNPRQVPGICVDGDAWVYVNNGSKRLRDVGIGDKVRTLRGMRRVIEKRNLGKKKVLEITLESGRRLKVTPNHKLLNADRSLVWRRAENLQVGSWLITSSHDSGKRSWVELDNDIELSDSYRTINPRKIPGILTPDVAEFLGLFVAEGSGHIDGGAKITQFEPITNQRVLDLCWKIWKRNNVSPKSLGRSISLLLQNWGVTFGSFNKSIPDIVLESSNDILRAFLKGYYAGDGWFSKNGLCSTAGTRSKQLRDDLLYALLRLGVSARATVGQFGAVHGVPMHMVRTSDRENTSNAFSQFAPDRCSEVICADPSTSKYNSGSFSDRIPIDAVNGVLIEKAKLWAKSQKGSSRLVPISQIVKELPGLDVWKRLKEEGLIIEKPRKGKGRLKGSGRLQHFASMSDALSATFDARVRRNFLQLCIRSDTPTCHRKKLHKMLARLPVKIRDEVALHLKTFLREDIFFERIKSIEKIGATEVYDIGVEGEPNFFANGICVHNCKHGIIVINALRAENPIWEGKNSAVTKEKAASSPVHLTTLDTMIKRVRNNKV